MASDLNYYFGQNPTAAKVQNILELLLDGQFSFTDAQTFKFNLRYAQNLFPEAVKAVFKKEFGFAVPNQITKAQLDKIQKRFDAIAAAHLGLNRLLKAVLLANLFVPKVNETYIRQYPNLFD